MKTLFEYELDIFKSLKAEELRRAVESFDVPLVRKGYAKQKSKKLLENDMATDFESTNVQKLTMFATSKLSEGHPIEISVGLDEPETPVEYFAKMTPKGHVKVFSFDDDPRKIVGPDDFEEFMKELIGEDNKYNVDDDSEYSQPMRVHIRCLSENEWGDILECF